jgi:alpha-glucosidase
MRRMPNSSLQQFIKLCHQHDIPCDSFQLSSGYTSIGNKRYVFNWNYDKVPQPKQLSQAFHDAGLKLAANIKPCLLQDHPQYQQAAQLGLFIPRFRKR